MNQEKRAIQSSYGSECPVCHGTGWQIYTEHVEGYKEPIEFSKICPKCKGRRRMNDKTGIPPEYCNTDISKFDFSTYRTNMDPMKKIAMSFVNDFPKWQERGKGLYFWSNTPGSGKTFLACCLARSLMIKYGLQMRFITAPFYIDAVRESIKRARGEEDRTKVYRECDVLVFDDIGAQSGGEWQGQEIFNLINNRMEEGKITIYTSNVDVNELNVGSRTRDRIVKTSIILRMPEEGLREKKAELEQQQFLQMILQK